MTVRKLPEAKTFARPKNFQWDAPSDVLAKWAERPLAAESDDPNTISIYDVIGEDFWTGGGFTAKRMASALALDRQRRRDGQDQLARRRYVRRHRDL
jgi:ATP-dependent Clp protease protease subunit